MENEAIYISTSEEGQLEILNNQPTENLRKRIIKRPLFYDELDDSSDESNLYFLLLLFLQCKFIFLLII